MKIDVGEFIKGTINIYLNDREYYLTKAELEKLVTEGQQRLLNEVAVERGEK